jgi:hypothetical protein
MTKKTSLMIGAGALAAAALTALAATGSAQATNPRFGHWKLKSEAPAPQSNIMTYEPLGDKGMKITIDAVNKEGVKSQWWYTTHFDGKDETLTGNPGTDTGSVRIITDRINEIVYKKDGKVTQVLTNVLSPDGQSIGVMYMRQNAEGKTTNVTFATYEKMK